MKTVDISAIIHAIQTSTSTGTKTALVAVTSHIAPESRMAETFVTSLALAQNICTGMVHVKLLAHHLSNIDLLKAKTTAILHAQIFRCTLTGMAPAKLVVPSP